MVGGCAGLEPQRGEEHLGEGTRAAGVQQREGEEGGVQRTKLDGKLEICKIDNQK